MRAQPANVSTNEWIEAMELISNLEGGEEPAWHDSITIDFLILTAGSFAFNLWFYNALFRL
jgi:hypothetical protein